MSSFKSTRKNNYLNSLNTINKTKTTSTSNESIVTIQEANTFSSKDSAPNKKLFKEVASAINDFDLEEFNLSNSNSYSQQILNEINNEDSDVNLMFEELSNINKNINREFLTTKNYLNLDFDLLSNNKDNINVLNSIVDKKNEIVDSLFKNIENQFKSVLKRVNNYKYVKNKVEEKIKNESELFNNLKNGLSLRKDTIVDIDLGRKLYNRLADNKTISDLNLITNYFIENYDKVELKQRNNQKENKFSLDTDEYSYDIKIIGDISQISQLNLMLDFNSSNDNNMSDSTGIIVQNFINNARSLYTLMPNCILDNDVSVRQQSKKANSKDFIVFSKENQNIELWDSINTNKQKVIYKSLLDSNNININNNKFILASDISNNNIIIKSISVNHENKLSVSGTIDVIGNIAFNIYNDNSDLLSKINNNNDAYLNLLSSETKNLINLCLANRLEFAPYLSAYLENNLINEETRLTKDSNHSFLREAEILSGKFYGQSLNSESLPARNYIFGNNDTPTLGEIIIKQNFSRLRFQSITQNFLRPITNSFKKSISNNVFNIFYQNLPMFVTVNYGRLETTLKEDQFLQTLFEVKNSRFTSNLSRFYNDYKFNHIDFKLKIDSLVKNIKLERLTSLGVDVKPFNDVIKNIKRSRNKLYFGEYNHNDKEMTCILNEENSLFKVLFTKNDEDEYINNISFNYKNSYINKKLYKANVSNTIPDDDSKVIEIMSNYYPSGQFFSTTSMLLKILNNFNNYVKKFNNKDRNETITEIFYMNYFSNNNDADVLKRVSRRFIVNSIANDKNVYSDYRKDIKAYQYDNTTFDGYKDKIKKELKNFTGSDEEIKNKADSILLELSEQYLSSNDDLKTIRNEIYSDETIRRIAKEYDYKFVFANNFFESIISKTSAGKIVTLQQVFPFSIFANSKKIREPTNQDSFADSGNNDIFIYKKLPDLNLVKRQNDFVIDNENSNSYFNNKNINFDIVFDRIKIGEAEGEKLLKNNFEEKFEDLCKNKNSIFGMICETIREMLSIIDISYIELNLKTEDEINSYIDSNVKIIEIVTEIVQIFADIYQSIIKNIIFDHTLKIFNELIKPYYTDTNDSLLSDSFLTGNTLDTLILDTFNLSNESNESEIFRKTFEKVNYSLDSNSGISKSINLLIDSIKRSENKIKIVQDEIDFNNTLYKKTNDNIFYRKMLHVINDIIRSDISQAMSFDISRSVFKQQEIINENIENIKNQHLINFIEDLGIEENSFFEKINNKYYQNVLIKNINDIEKRNDKLKNIREGLLESPETYIQDENLFDQVKSERLYDQIDYNTNNMYSFSIKTSDMLTNDSNSLIKITIQPRDISESDRLYLPIIYYFSTSFLSLNNSIDKNNSYLFVENEILSNKEYAELDYTKLSLNKTDVIDENITNRIKEIISNKVTSNQEKIDIIYENILENHRMSHKLKKIAAAKFDINVNSINNNDRKELTDVLNVIPDNIVANIFKTTKQDLYQNIDDIKHYNEYYEMNNAVNYLFSTKIDNDKISDTIIYDRYLLSLPSNLFYAKPKVSNPISAIPGILRNNSGLGILRNNFGSLINATSNLDLLTKLSFIELDLQNDNQMSYYKDKFNNDRKTLMFAIKMELL